MQKQIDGLDELKTFKEKYEKIEAEQRTSLLEQIPEANREEFKDESIESLARTISLIGGKPGSFNGSGKKTSPGAFDWSTATEAEKGAYKIAHPEEATKLIAAEVAKESRW